MGVGGRRVIGVLMGGTSAEHDVSVCGGLNVLDALPDDRFDARPVYIARDGIWHFGYRPEEPSLERSAGEDAEARADTGRVQPARVTRETPGIIERLRAGEFDAVFIVLHGPGGEDGVVQGLLEAAGVPYTGSGVMASALAMDKQRAKVILNAAGIPVARGEVVVAGAAPLPTDLDNLVRRVGLPCVVKPVHGGSSFGTQLVNSREDLPGALDDALRADHEALVETALEGVEVTCGVLGEGDAAIALPLTEIRPRSGTFFDFRAKYTAAACEEITPARVDPTVADAVQDLSRRGHVALGCEGMSRADFIVTAEGPVILEINTIPGMTRTSLLPQGAAAAGIGFAALTARLVDAALARGVRHSSQRADRHAPG